ncbi:MAG TPA: hypothetical protein PKA27_16865 [Fimbriimonadaceae bacterium]|nr:hypothetical protein [Fimbriimonadaceae bacterium]
MSCTVLDVIQAADEVTVDGTNVVPVSGLDSAMAAAGTALTNSTAETVLGSFAIGAGSYIRSHQTEQPEPGHTLMKTWMLLQITDWVFNFN